MITIYSTPTCVYCKTLKEYLDSKKISYTEIDVSDNEKELEKMVAISGQMGVPVILVDDELIVGFDRTKLARILGIS